MRPERDQPPRSDDDLVDESSDESFPASDPPSWEPLHSGSPRKAPPPPRPSRTNDEPPPDHGR